MPKAQLWCRNEKLMSRGLLFVSHQLMQEVVVLKLQVPVDLRGCRAFAVLVINPEKAASIDSCKALQGAAWKPGRNRKFTGKEWGKRTTGHFVRLETMGEKNLPDWTYWPKFRESLAES